MNKQEIYMNGAFDRLFGSWKSCKVLISLLAGFFLLLTLCAPIPVQAQPPSEGPQIPVQAQPPSDQDATLKDRKGGGEAYKTSPADFYKEPVAKPVEPKVVNDNQSKPGTRRPVVRPRPVRRSSTSNPRSPGPEVGQP